MLLPSVLLIASGAAFGGMAVLPAAAHDTPRAAAAAALASVDLEVPGDANVALMSTLSKGVAVANIPEPAPPAPKPTQAPRASRNRSPAAPSTENASAEGSAGAEFFRPSVGRLTSGYGRRWGRLHAGVDLAAGTGSPIRAVAGATVLSAGDEGGYGRVVRLQHADGTVTVYAHMSAVLVGGGEKVAAGALVGREGNTGQSTGPHLHFEVRINGVPVNPITWLRARGVLL